MKKFGALFIIVLMATLVLVPTRAKAAEKYVIDTDKAHAFIQFKVSHLSYSWVLGRFNTFEGQFSFDEKNPDASKVEVTIDTASVDTNHAKRDKHLRGDDFLDVEKYPKATFVSTNIRPTGKDTAVIIGDLTLHGVTRKIEILAKHIGAGDDPWGGYRRGFEGTTTFALKDFNIKKDLGPTSQTIELFLSIEGIRQK